MKKKLLAILLTVLMVASLLPMTALAANVSASVKGNDVTITVDGIDNVFKGDFVKNGAKTFTLEDGSQVKVEFNGNGVKNVTVVTMPPASTPPTQDGLPNNGDSDGQKNLFGDLVLDQYNNADFHCNADGNGRVWTTLGKSVTQKLSVPLHFVANTGQPVSEQANAATAWHLVHNNVYICEECGSAEWVTYSNNSGLPDGKNIQMNHPGQYIEILKYWLDANGDPVTGKDLSAKFKITWTGADGKEFSKIVGPGKYFFANDLIDSIKVEEISTSNHYTLILINGEPFEILAPVELDENLSVSFTNKEDPYAIIEKKWDIDGEIITAGSIVVDGETINAYFDIYEYDEDEDGNPIRGDLLKAGLLAGEKFYAAPGKCIAAEQAKPGFVEQEDQVIDVIAGEVSTYTFINTPIITPKGTLSIDKTVDRSLWGLWVLDYYDKDISEFTDDEKAEYSAILDGLTFKLYKVAENGAEYDKDDPICDGAINLNGVINFADEDELDLAQGWYAVVETVSGAAIGVFDYEDTDDDGNGLVIQYFFISGPVDGKYLVSGSDFDFDYTATYHSYQDDGMLFTVEYEVDAAHESWTSFNPEYQYYPTNPWFGNFKVKAPDETVYPSYCAYWFSGNVNQELIDQTAIRFANNPTAKANIIKALNYIYDEYGSVDQWPASPTNVAGATKLIAQLVVWNLLEDGVISTNLLTEGYGFINNAVNNVLANYADAETSGAIVDIVFLAQEGFVFDDGNYITGYQPQLVPVFGGGTFDNTGIPGFKGVASFSKVVDVDFDIDDGFDYSIFKFDLYKLEDGGDPADIADYTIQIVNDDEDSVDGTFSPNAFGNVRVEDLDVGYYVFVEQDISGWVAGTYAGGLFFEIRKVGHDDHTFWLIDGEYVLGESGDMGEVGPDFDNISLGKIKVRADVTLLEKWIKQTHKEAFNRIGKKDTVILADGTPLLNAENDHFGYIVIDPNEESTGSLRLAVGSNKDYIGVDVNYEIVGGELNLFFDGDLYGNVAASVRAIVSNSPIPWNNDTNGQHLAIGTGDAYTALELFGPVDFNQDVYLFVHFAEIWVDDLANPYCVLYTTTSGTRPYEGYYDYTIAYSIDGGNTLQKSGKFGDLAPGKYTVMIYIDGEYYNEQDLTVTPGATTKYTFKVNITVNEGAPEQIIDCPRDCGEWLD